MSDKRIRPRWLQRLVALFGGYFWLPCPLCGEKFGGHEKHGVLRRDMNTGQLVCANCIQKAEEMNIANGLGYVGLKWEK